MQNAKAPWHLEPGRVLCSQPALWIRGIPALRLAGRAGPSALRLEQRAVIRLGRDANRDTMPPPPPPLLDPFGMVMKSASNCAWPPRRNAPCTCPASAAERLGRHCLHRPAPFPIPPTLAAPRGTSHRVSPTYMSPRPTGHALPWIYFQGASSLMLFSPSPTLKPESWLSSCDGCHCAHRD